MGILPAITTKRRQDNVRQADSDYIVSGIIFIALGTLIASIATLPVTDIIKLIVLIAGICLCIKGITDVVRFYKEVRAFSRYKTFWDKNRGMYDRFANELNDWYEHGILPASCDGDTKYFLKLQKDRLDSKGIRLVNQVLPARGDTYGTAGFRKTSSWYTAEMMYESVISHLGFFSNDKKLYEKNQEETMYEMIIHSPNERELASITMTCPNCGSLSLVSDLENGCRYCQTRFSMSELFPRVTNLYFVKNNSTTRNRTLSRKIIGWSMACVFVFMLAGSLASDDMILPVALFTTYLATLFIGGFAGIIITDIVLVASLFDNGGRKRIPFFKAIKTKSCIRKIMQQSDHNFSYEKFESEIISLIRMAVFADNPSALAAYAAPSRDMRFNDIVEMTYTNCMTFEGSHVDGNILHMRLCTWWINYYEDNGRIKKRGDIIEVSVMRNIAITDKPGFSITSVRCPDCGGSFDAVRQCICPYCGTAYHMENDGFIIESMKL